jgi:hypothetical protein
VDLFAHQIRLTDRFVVFPISADRLFFTASVGERDCWLAGVHIPKESEVEVLLQMSQIVPARSSIVVIFVASFITANVRPELMRFPSTRRRIVRGRNLSRCR